MKLFPLAILIVLCGFQASNPAIIKGTVTDTLTTAPVESALVQVEGTSAQATPTPMETSRSTRQAAFMVME
jgi:hypothetical protein